MPGSADDEGSTETDVAGGDDRIGALPDDILRHLLSFLPSRNSVQTCVLAKRWRILWKSVPALRINDETLGWLSSHQVYQYCMDGPDDYDCRQQRSKTFVEELLRRRDPTHLNVCQIYSSYWDPDGYDDDDGDDTYLYEEVFQRIEPWLQYALSHDVRVLRVEASALTTNLALVSSHLKRVELISMRFDGSLDFSSCPVLDVLEMSSCTFSANILSQSLRHLSITDGFFHSDICSRISSPKLISLKLAPYCYRGLALLLDTMPSLVTAFIIDNPTGYQQYGQESFSMILEGMSCATNLQLISTSYQNCVYRMDLVWCPMFSKLKSLLLNDWCMADNFSGLVYFLQHSPILETLTLHLNYLTDWSYHLIEPYEICNSREQGYNSREKSLLSKHLKVVKIIRGKKEDVIIQRISEILCAHGVPFEQIDIQ